VEKARRIFAYLLIALTASPVAAAAPQSLTVELAVDRARAPVTATVTTSWLGEPLHAALRDDGSTPGDVPGDFVYVGRLDGEPVRALDLVLAVDGVPVGEALVLPDGEHDRVSFVLDGAHARRAALAATATAVERRESVEVAAFFGWTLLLLVAVLGLAARTRR